MIIDNTRASEPGEVERCGLSTDTATLSFQLSYKVTAVVQSLRRRSKYVPYKDKAGECPWRGFIVALALAVGRMATIRRTKTRAMVKN